jgi:hypothetical protein
MGEIIMTAKNIHQPPWAVILNFRDESLKLMVTCN